MASLKVLRVVGRMDRGGIETSIMQVLRCLDFERFSLDFLYVDPGCSSVYDEELRALGIRIHNCSKNNPLFFARRFKQLNKEFGPFDVVHSSLHRFNGYVAKVAAENNIPVRIVHSHSDTSSVDADAGLLRRAYIYLQNYWIKKYATSGLALSANAAVSLFGIDWQADPRWKIFYEGRDLREYSESIDRNEVRRELKIAQDAYVIGHVGRLAEVKNHRFLLKVFKLLLKQLPTAQLLLVGDGPLKEQLQKEISQDELVNSVIMLGDRSDVSRLLLGAIDVLVMPSLYEGGPLALVEAQAAGVPCVCSDNIAVEMILVSQLVCRLSLGAPLEQWVAACLNPNRVPQLEALRTVKDTPFNLETCVRYLEQEYAGSCRRETI